MKDHPLIRNWIIVIAVILLLLTMGLTIGGRSSLTFVENTVLTVIQPVQSFLSGITDDVLRFSYPLRNAFKNSEENDALRAALLKTQRELIEQTMLKAEYEDLKELRAALNYTQQNNISDYITADVIARDAENWYGMFAINVGASDGITENSMVFNGEGLIGQVFEVGEHRSNVLTISDARGSVSFKIVDPIRSFDGVVSGTAEDKLSGYLFDTDAEIFIGDQIITSGLGIYPKGIAIGKISAVYDNEDTLLKNIDITPAVDFKRIERVFVIPYKLEGKQE